jgi:hypothetical protein
MLQPTETVTRPDPGLARGKWEAPAWAFWLALALIVAFTAAYVLRRMGMLRFGTKADKAAQTGQGKQP